MAVPLLDLAAQHAPLLEELRRAFDGVLASGKFVVPSPEIERLETSLAQVCGTRHAVSMSSGTDALLAALMALGIGPGDEVITSPFTFFATAGVIARVGARPVFVDIEPDTFNIDADRIEVAITSRARAIMPVHLFGQCADMAAINDIARRHKLFVIEDAAQAIAARQGDQPAGSMSHIGCLSFYPTKNLAALGDAGACLTGDDDLARRLRAVRLHGQTGEYQHEIVGGNFRLDAVQAALLNVKLPHLAAWTEARRQRAELYHELLAELPVQRPVERAGRRHVYNQYTIRVGDRRNELRQHLTARGIGNKVYYPLPLHLQSCFAYLGGRRGDLPQAERAAGQVLSLPMYPEITAAQQREVAQAVGEFFQGG